MKSSCCNLPIFSTVAEMLLSFLFSWFSPHQSFSVILSHWLTNLINILIAFHLLVWQILEQIRLLVHDIINDMIHILIVKHLIHVHVFIFPQMITLLVLKLLILLAVNTVVTGKLIAMLINWLFPAELLIWLAINATERMSFVMPA